MPREKSAGAIIFRREDNGIYYLLLRHNPSRPEQKRGGHWDLPKGHIEVGESELETVKREVKEETGIGDIKIIPGFKETIKYFFRQYRENVSEKDRKKGKTPWVFKAVVFYLAETKTKEIKISPEHKAARWLPYSAALEQLTFKNAKNILAKANDYLELTKR